MPQSKKRKPPKKEPPLKINFVYPPPSAEGDACWLRALKILMEATPEPEHEKHKGGTRP